MIDLIKPIAQLAADVQSGKIKAEELVKAALAKIEQDKAYHTVLEVSLVAVERARQIDTRIQSGEQVGRLAGVPFIAKDNFLTLGTHTTAASHILEPFQAPYQSTAINKLEAEGAVMVAKANLDAFAHGSSTENSDFGPSKNPWDAEYVPGGSSGGSAAAVALGQCSFALGTDTGGSIRLPAAFCGVVGLKPTYGLISRFGVIAMASSTDVIGPITRSVADASLLLDIMAGPDVLDATTIPRADSYTQPKQNLKGLKIGVIKEYLDEGLEPAVKQSIEAAISQLEGAGAQVQAVSLPSVKLALACYYIIMPAEVSSNLARYDGIKYGYSAKGATNLREVYEMSRDEGFGAEAKRRIAIGTYVLSSGYYDAYYKKAQVVRSLLVQEFDEAFGKFDLLVGPAAPTAAFKLGQKTHDPLEMYLTDIMTVAANLVGNCAITIPAGHNEAGLPIGLQLMAPQHGEEVLLGAALAAEALIGTAA